MTNSIPCTIQEWDSFLIKEYGYSIMNFAYCIAEFIWESDPKYRRSRGTEVPRAVIFGKDGIKEFIKYDAARLKRLKVKIIYTLYKSLLDCGMLEKGDPTKIGGSVRIKREDQEKFIKRRKNRDSIFEIFPEAKSFIKRLDKIISIQKGELYQNPSKRGAPVKVYRKIAFVLAQIMKDERGIRWKRINQFMKWFVGKLATKEYYKVLGEDSFSGKSLKEDYYETIKRKKSKSASAWFDWKEEIELERNFYFGKKYHLPSIRIEFKKESVNTDMPKEDLPLLTFPDGDTYMAAGEAEAYREQLEKKAEEYEKLFTAVMATHFPQDPRIQFTPDDHKAYRKYRALRLEDKEDIK